MQPHLAHVFLGSCRIFPKTRTMSKCQMCQGQGSLCKGRAVAAGMAHPAWPFGNMVMEDESHLQKTQSHVLAFLGFWAVP